MPNKMTCISMKNLTAIAFIVAMMCSGCGTIISHNDEDHLSDTINHGVYRGVRTDYHWVADAVPETEMGAPLYCLDMPFSLVADTFCLPYDIVVVIQQPKTETTNTSPSPNPK